MREALIVSTARTPIGKAYRGLFNNTEAPTMGGIAIRAAVERAGVDPAEVDDVIMGCAMPQGTCSLNPGRLAALAGGLPVSVSGMTMDRQCSSGLMSIAPNLNFMLAAHLCLDNFTTDCSRSFFSPTAPSTVRAVDIMVPANSGIDIKIFTVVRS